MQKIIAIINTKGGDGKSFLTQTGAVEHQMRTGETPAIIDADAPQFSVAAWADVRLRYHGKDTPHVYQARNQDELINVAEGSRHEENYYPFVLIDTTGASRDTIATALEIADLAVIPLQPRAKSIATLPTTKSYVEQMKARAVVVINQGNPLSPGENEEARHAIEPFGLPVCPHVLMRRKAFTAADNDGRVAQELDADPYVTKAANEFSLVWAWIMTMMEPDVWSTTVEALHKKLSDQSETDA